MVFIELQIVCHCGSKCSATIDTSDNIKDIIVCKGGCAHFPLFKAIATTTIAGWLTGKSTINVKIQAVCGCDKQYEDCIREFTSWPRYSRTISSFYCKTCNFTLCYEVLEPYHYASFTKKVLLDPSQLILEVLGQHAAATVLKAIEASIPDGPDVTGDTDLSPNLNK